MVPCGVKRFKPTYTLGKSQKFRCCKQRGREVEWGQD